MKLVSWNVNGFRSVLNSGFKETFLNMNADIFCVQETKAQEGQFKLDIEGYYEYWNFAKRKGYSGVAIFTKEKPISASYGINNEELDKEGRVITLEFEEFYIVNTYTPCYQRNIKRQNYRQVWDVEFIKYIKSIEKIKPVIICGDFNVAHKELDIGNLSKKILGFSDEERKQFSNLLGMGYIDTFRYKKTSIKSFTWWKNHKRNIPNNGCRLDYFLVSKELKDRIFAVQIRNDIEGSDHCPIVLKLKNHRKVKESSNTIEFPKEKLRTMWQEIDWEKAEGKVFKMQQKLTRCAIAKDYEEIKKWQIKIVTSLEARELAVRKVTETSSSAGVDGVKWKTDEDKMRAVISLNSIDYKAKPLKRFIIQDKRGLKERRIGIPTMQDRAMQALHYFSLEPVAEAFGDRKSFAFRKYRGGLDAHACLWDNLADETCPEWVLITDVENFYESVSHDWIMRHIPMDKRVLKEFIKAGMCFDGEIFPRDVGINLGSSLSPTIRKYDIRWIAIKTIWDTRGNNNRL